MSVAYADRVKETSTTTGTGAITLAGAVSQFQSFNTAIGLNVWTPYAIVGQSGTEWEVGEGYLSGATTLVRANPRAGSAGAGVLVTFSAGTKDVFVATSGAALNRDVGLTMVLANNFAGR